MSIWEEDDVPGDCDPQVFPSLVVFPFSKLLISWVLLIKINHALKK